MSEQKSLKEYVKQEKARIEVEREAKLNEFMKEHDRKPFIKWPQNVTEFTLMPVIPRNHESYGKPKKVFRIKLAKGITLTNNKGESTRYEPGSEFDWSVNPRSPLYDEALDKLVKAPVKLKLNRMGEGLATRYSLI